MRCYYIRNKSDCRVVECRNAISLDLLKGRAHKGHLAQPNLLSQRIEMYPYRMD
nr:hypothetical protein Q903MT_gene2901 [Picea sitchensis]